MGFLKNMLDEGSEIPQYTPLEAMKAILGINGLTQDLFAPEGSGFTFTVPPAVVTLEAVKRMESFFECKQIEFAPAVVAGANDTVIPVLVFHFKNPKNSPKF